MEAGIAVITLVVVLVALLISGYQLKIQLEKRRQRREREKPQVSVHLLKVWQVGRGAQGADVGIQVSVENRSAEPDTLRSLTVEFDGRRFSVPKAEDSLALRSYGSPQDEPAAPRPLTPCLPENFRFHFSTDPRQVSENDRLPATFVADCSNAGEVRQDFTVYPR